MMRIAIIGGGPGGLFTASLLEEQCADLCEITLFEAASRLGGKVVTQQFSSAPVKYEAGVAELYDYSGFGPDPLQQLLVRLGLRTTAMKGPAVILGNTVLRNARDIRRHFGGQTLAALQAFQRQCRELCSPADYYEGHWQDDNQHPWANKTFRDVLDEIPDDTARRYVEVAVHSDLATESHLTTALNGLKNVLMDDPRYMRLCAVEGGIERLTERLADGLKARTMLESPVVALDKHADGTYRLTTRRQGKYEDHQFDLVVLALPNYWLAQMDWGSRELRQSMQKHLAHYDYPAHYLRMTLLFERPFWREQVPGSFFMMDAFGGCCVYDESSRFSSDHYGVLGWLLAGNDALALNNHSDQRLIELALDSLPEPLAEGRQLYLEGRVHRWTGTISGLPGGNPTLGTRERHLPDPHHHAGLFVVGDYLFDSTINGAYDSAALVKNMILTLLRKQKYTTAPAVVGTSSDHAVSGNGNGKLAAARAKNRHASHLDHDYHDLYDGERPYHESFKEFFCEQYTIDLIRTIWGWSPPYQLLDCGSASGLTLDAFARVGVEAWGVENSEHIHAQTAPAWQKRNLRGDIRKLPFADNSFDFVYDTCLCYVPDDELDQAVSELLRVCRVGVFFGGITSDMTREVIEAYEILESVRSLYTLWEWSEVFLRNGFRIAASDPKVLARAWKIETDANEGDFPWYPDPESMRYCFYSKPGAVAVRPKKKRPKTTTLQRS